MKRSKLLAATYLVLMVAIQALVPSTLSGAQAVAKNVIVLVPDGCNSTGVTLARWYKDAPLALDEMVSGAVRTYSAESLITDSAPAATAFATGYKSNSKFISVLPDKVTIPGLDASLANDRYRPVATLLEAAKLSGKATGIISTSNIQHATPAAFTSHWYSRSDYNEIAEQQVYQMMDVVLGGGKQYLVPKSAGGKRTDGEDLVGTLRKMGYEFVETSEQLARSSSSRIWGMFAADSMAYDMDRNPAIEPSLAEMTQKAISVLSKSPNGFFLFVEGSEVDWACHANDPIGVIGDVLAFDAAVKVALDFAKKDQTTLVVAFTDHGNGGMSIGAQSTNTIYDKLPYDFVLSPLKRARLTGQGLEAKLNNDRSNAAAVVAEYYGIGDLTQEELQAIKKAAPGTLNAVVGPMMSARSGIGWTTTGHTGEDVFLYSFGPGKLIGLYENSAVALKIADAMGLDLGQANANLFVKARPAFEALGATVTWVTTDPANPVVVIEKGSHRAELPVSKNAILINGTQYTMSGLTIFSRGTTYVPQQAIDMFRNATK